MTLFKEVFNFDENIVYVYFDNEKKKMEEKKKIRYNINLESFYFWI